MFNWGTKKPVFILGCQRSGTTICQDIFRATDDYWVLGEGNKLAMTDQWRLRPENEIKALIRRSRRKNVLVKPINDSHLASNFLETFDGLRVVWIYRSMFDTSNSAVRKWGAAQKDMVVWLGERIAAADSLESAMQLMDSWPSCAVYAEGLSNDTCDKLVRWTREPVSDHEGAAIMWYLRNQFYFDQALSLNDRVNLISYENLVSNPSATIRDLCTFLDARYSDRLVESIHASSVGKSSPPDINDDIAENCNRLTMQFDQVNSELPQAVMA